MRTPEKLNDLANGFLEAWNSQDVNAVLSCYTDDLVYHDPNTRGCVVGAEGLRRYLTKLFSAWTMTWSLREIHPFRDSDGAAILWHATFARVGQHTRGEADGMDLVTLRGALIQRNEVYFDRSVLGSP